MQCACCGDIIVGEYHETKYGFVCNECWDNPDLFFSERLLKNDRWRKVFSFLVNESEDTVLQVPVIKLKQKGVTLYTGKIDAKALLKLYTIDLFYEKNLSGYQRQLHEDKIDSIYEYLLMCPIAIMPSILVSLRKRAHFEKVPNSDIKSKKIPHMNDMGTLSIPFSKGALTIVDGQHRIGGFERILAHIGASYENGKNNSDVFLELMNYELPALFIDSSSVISASHFNRDDDALTPLDVERALFYVVNKTQTRINSSLTDALQLCIEEVGINGIPVLEKDSWRTLATSISIRLNRDSGSPLKERINVSGFRGDPRPISLNSFVTSLKHLMKHPIFQEMDDEKKVELLKSYWTTISNMFEDAFKAETSNKYLILNTLGFYTLNWILFDYCKYAFERKIPPLNTDNLRWFLAPLSKIDWSKENSPFASFGGMKGVISAHEYVVNKIYDEILEPPVM